MTFYEIIKYLIENKIVCLCVTKNYIMFSCKVCRYMTRPRVTPHNLVSAILIPKDLIHHHLDIMSHMPV